MRQDSDKIRDLLKAGMVATERGDYKTGYEALNAYYSSGYDDLPEDGLSHYGLCVAVVEKQTRKGVELCQAAIKSQFYQSVHYANLVTLYLERDDRKNAVKVLEKGLRRSPEDARLDRIKDEIGYRRPPILPFLARRNPVNVVLGRVRVLLGR